MKVALIVMSIASIAMSAPMSDSEPDPDPGMTGAERQQVRTLQQEMAARKLFDRRSGEKDKRQTDRLRVLQVPIDATNLQQLTPSSTYTSYGTGPTATGYSHLDENVWVWSTESQRFVKQNGWQQGENTRSALPSSSSQYIDQPADSRILPGPLPVKSTDQFRLYISPNSKLSGSPNEAVPIEFFLENNSPSYATFFMSLQQHPTYEDNGGGRFSSRPEAFDAEINPERPYIPSGRRERIIVNLRLPRSARARDQNSFTIDAHLQGSNERLSRRFLFNVTDPSLEADNERPTCELVAGVGSGNGLNTAEEQCSQYQGDCRNQKWSVQIQLKDLESGLRSVYEEPAVPIDSSETLYRAYYQHDNFKVGTREAQTYFYTATCCQKNVDLRVSDVAGNTATCKIGPGDADDTGDLNASPQVQSAGLDTLTIVIIVVVVLLVLVVVGAVAAIVVIKNKRKAELEEMRQTPQAR